jgi:hypothetical protein
MDEPLLTAEDIHIEPDGTVQFAVTEIQKRLTRSDDQFANAGLEIAHAARDVRHIRISI